MFIRPVSLFYFITLIFSQKVLSQDTIIIKELDHVIITATRTENKLSNVAVPVILINKKDIVSSGVVRVKDILGEQTGLYITGGGSSSSMGGGVFGNGVQIQGLSPDYTLILIDGEPVIGRQGGVIDMTRFGVANVKKIEIVKGPSSSLYGSEAMGGVINILTDQSVSNSIQGSFRYGRFNSTDANLDLGLIKNKWKLQLSGNRNTSEGFDLDPKVPGKSVDPSRNYSTQLKFSAEPSLKTRIAISGRYYNEVQDNYFITQDLNNGTSLAITGNGKVKDIALNPSLSYKFSKSINSTLRFYFTRYEYDQRLLKETDKSEWYTDLFQQDLFKIDNQTNFHFSKSHTMIFGAGIAREDLNTTRYDGKRSNDIRYAFFQDEWKAGQKMTLIGGMRFDGNTAYSSRLSPKIAMNYAVTDKLRIKASYGEGFKAPDFRQMFLNFLNTAAGGYVVYGANEITLDELEHQKQTGLISEILPRANDLTLLKPEISKGINASVHYEFSKRFNASLNFFRNDIRDLIQVEVIAYRSNAAPVYSYFNVKEAFTHGSELNASYILFPGFRISGGYQFLVTADKSHITQIKEGSVFGRDIQTGESYRLIRSEYKGLPDRSAHMANVKFFFDSRKKDWGGTLRLLYRSRWGISDKDGNGLINRKDELAPGFTMVNISGSKIIGAFRIQSGIDNLLNYKDKQHLPGQPGIQPYLSVSYTFISNQKNK